MRLDKSAILRLMSAKYFVKKKQIIRETKVLWTWLMVLGGLKGLLNVFPPQMTIEIGLSGGNNFLMLFGFSKQPKRWIVAADAIYVWLLDDAFRLINELAKQSSCLNTLQ